MLDGLPKSLMRWSQQLTAPGQLRRVLQDAGERVRAIPLPDLPKLPDLKIPDLKIPDLKIPELKLPELKLPDLPRMPGMPDMPLLRPVPSPGADGTDGGVTEVAAFGSNPGNLKMFRYVPRTAPANGAPVVVVLHGCGQHAATFARDAGWMALADRVGAVLVLPEQVGGNNAGRCFNWFRAEDTRHGGGEALSIREMVAETISRCGADPRRVFAVGLSAGGGMTAGVLAAYPDVFAAGAVVAGLPVGAASDVSAAMAAMSGRGPQLAPGQWAEKARAMAPAGYAGPWPRLSLWHGTGDRTVAAVNSEMLAAQWAALNGVEADGAPEVTVAKGLRRRVWRADGRDVVESWTIDDFAHGYPVDGGPVADRFVLPIGIDATAAIARFWGLLRAD